MTPDEFYRATIHELRGRLLEPTPYNIVKSAGLLRQMFLDAQPLVNSVKKGRDVTIAFYVIKDAKLPDDLPAPILHWRDPAPPLMMPDTSTEFVSQDRFLAHPCSEFNGRSVTVRNIIRYGAHVLGGIHRYAPKDPADFILDELDRSIRFGAHTMSMRALKGIAQVTLVGLDPLTRSVGGI